MKRLTQVASSSLPTIYGTFKLLVYKTKGGKEHAALVGKKAIVKNPFVRIHSRCLTGDTFASRRCDCRQQLQKSLKIINKNGGVIVYLNQEGRGLGLANKVKAYALQDQGMDTVEANKALYLPIDNRDYMVAAQILKDLGISKVKLLTNNPEKLKQLEKYGIKISKRVPLEVKPQLTNLKYLKAKKAKLGHKLKLV